MDLRLLRFVAVRDRDRPEIFLFSSCRRLACGFSVAGLRVLAAVRHRLHYVVRDELAAFVYRQVLPQVRPVVCGTYVHRAPYCLRRARSYLLVQLHRERVIVTLAVLIVRVVPGLRYMQLRHLRLVAVRDRDRAAVRRYRRLRHVVAALRVCVVRQRLFYRVCDLLPAFVYRQISPFLDRTVGNRHCHGIAYCRLRPVYRLVQLYRRRARPLAVLIVVVRPRLRHLQLRLLVVHPREGDSSQVGVGIGRYRGSHFGSRAARRRGHPLTPCVSDCDDRLVKDVRAGDRLLTEIIGLILIYPVEMDQSIAVGGRRVGSSQGNSPGCVGEYISRRRAIGILVQHELGVSDRRTRHVDLFDYQGGRQDIPVLEEVVRITRFTLHRPSRVSSLKGTIMFIYYDREVELQRSLIVDPRCHISGIIGRFLYDIIHELPFRAVAMAAIIIETERAHVECDYISVFRFWRKTNGKF